MYSVTLHYQHFIPLSSRCLAMLHSLYLLGFDLWTTRHFFLSSSGVLWVLGVRWFRSKPQAEVKRWKLIRDFMGKKQSQYRSLEDHHHEDSPGTSESGRSSSDVEGPQPPDRLAWTSCEGPQSSSPSFSSRGAQNLASSTFLYVFNSLFTMKWTNWTRRQQWGDLGRTQIMWMSRTEAWTVKLWPWTFSTPSRLPGVFCFLSFH